MHSIAKHILAQPALELCPDVIEQRVIRAYVGLLFRPPAGGSRTTTVGWVGPREIRLTETEPDCTLAGTPPFWVEVYCHVRGAVLDSCGCFEFDDDEFESIVTLVMDAGRDSREGPH